MSRDDFLSQSDEDFLNSAPDAPEELYEEQEEVIEDSPEVPEDEEHQEDVSLEEQPVDEGDDDEEPYEEEDAPEEPAYEGEEEDVIEEDQEEEDAPEEETPSEDVDYKAAYEQIFATFRANGRDMKVDSPEEVVSLMQMGANYNKKMAALKPNLRLLKMLDNNGLLDEQKLEYLIDLDKKNPQAISKLVKDSGLDPMDIDPEEASDYKPNTYTVSDKEMELDTVLSELESTPTYNRTLDVVSTKWDVASRKEIANNPQILRVLNEHIGNGVYDLVIEEVERERTFGRLNGVSDLEAYKMAGDVIQARGGFNHLVPDHAKPQPVRKRLAPSRPKEDTQTQIKRRAAGSTRSSAPSRSKNEYDPLAMSDAEFEKLMGDKFL